MIRPSLDKAATLVVQSARGVTGAWPDFLIIGAAKAGTTSLYDYLTAHPRIASASEKEVRYFDMRYRWGPLWYRAHFPSRALLQDQGHITGEASPMYLFHPHVAPRVRRMLPDVRLIVTLRDPVTRALSHWGHRRRVGHESRDFDVAIAEERAGLDAVRAKVRGEDPGWHVDLRLGNYIARGIYADQLERWYGLFDRDQILVVKSEDLFADPAREVPEVTRWLGVGPFVLADTAGSNVGSYPSEIGERTVEWLRSFYRPQNERLYALIGRDLGWP